MVPSLFQGLYLMTSNSFSARKVTQRFRNMLSVYYAWRTDILAFLGDSLDFVGEPM